jgi:DsbC/DsbD-like thiol-disulfide interchange protein
MRRLTHFLTATVAAFAVVSALAVGLSIVRSDAGAQGMSANMPKGGHVTFIADGQSIAAGRPATVALHFRVDPGFHINSHTPKSDMLIPTKILVEDMNGAEVSDVSFPVGTPYSFAFEPNTKLDVYTGEVTLTAHIKAKPGSYTLKAALHYQACDQAACYPPKTLPVEQPFFAK